MEGIDRFTINRVKFNWRNKSMDFSLTFRDLSLRGVFEGVGSFVKYIPISGRGNFTYSIYSELKNLFKNLLLKFTFFSPSRLLFAKKKRFDDKCFHVDCN